MELIFRSLNADEIDCRVAQVKLPDGDKKGGVSLLLYKDARVDQNILDETVGPMNWQRRHTRDNANCIVSLWDDEKKQWIEKEDTGTESNTEAEKGLASDSFKRACFNWGIGRELYTAPFIWISSDQCRIYSRKNNQGKDVGVCNDKFYVAKIQITDGKITQLFIGNASQGNQIVFSYGSLPKESTKAKEEPKPEPVKEEKKPEPKPATISEATRTDILGLAEKAGVPIKMVLQQAQVSDVRELSVKAGEDMIKALQRAIIRKNREARNGSERTDSIQSA